MELNNYKGLAVQKRVHTVSDVELEAKLEQIRANSPLTRQITDRPAADGDEVIIDYAGFVGETQFEGGTAEKQPLVLGSGTFIPGFEEQLVGASIGDKVDVKVTFPEEYHAPDLAGKEAVFHCTLHAINCKEEAVLDDAFARRVAGVPTLAEMSRTLKDAMQKNADDTAESELRNDLLAVFVKNCGEIEMTEAQIEAEVDKVVEIYSVQMQNQGLNMEMYLKFSGQTMEQLRADLRPQGEEVCRTNLALQELIRAEGIEAAPQDIEATMTALSQAYNMPMEKVRELCGEETLTSMKQDICRRKAIEFLVRHADITEVQI